MWAESFVNWHNALLVRRDIWRETKQRGIQKEITNVLNGQMCLVAAATLLSFVVLRKESWAIRGITTGLVFSVNFLHTVLIFEDQMFFRFSQQDNQIGKIIRDTYALKLPGSFFTLKMQKRQQEIEEFNLMFREREDPLRKFYPYAKKFNVELTKPGFS